MTACLSFLVAFLGSVAAARPTAAQAPSADEPSALDERLLQLVAEQRALLEQLPRAERERWLAELIVRLRQPFAAPPAPPEVPSDGGTSLPAPSTPASSAPAPSIPAPSMPAGETSAVSSLPTASSETAERPLSTGGSTPAPVTSHGALRSEEQADAEPESPAAPSGSEAAVDEADRENREARTPWANSDAAERLANADLPGESDASDDEAPRCSTLVPFDTSGDGAFSAADRNWRHFYLWNDLDRDEVVARDELTSLFDAGVRSVDMDLETFAGLDDRTGLIDQGEYLVFRSPKARARGAATSGRLVIDLEDLVRSTPMLLQDAAGESLSGLQALRRGLRIVTVDGGVTVVDCP